MMQAGKDYGVRVITAYDNRRIGQVFYPPGLLRDALVRSGRVERCQAPTDLLDGVTDEAALAESGRRRKGRVFSR